MRWGTRHPIAGTDLRGAVRKTGGRRRTKKEKIRLRSGVESAAFRPGFSWTVGAELLKGEGVNYRGRGGWGRQRGTCWLTS